MLFAEYGSVRSFITILKLHNLSFFIHTSYKVTNGYHFVKTLILGIDGYIGWSLAMHLARLGHTVSGIDNFARRRNVESIGSISAIPILDLDSRVKSFRRIHDKNVKVHIGDLLDYEFVSRVFRETKPDTIIHLGEQPSAPFSMIDREHAIYTQHNNVEGTLNVLYAMKDIVPNIHLVKLGTMGEYGTPNIDIPEGFFEVEYRGRRDVLPFPRQPFSMYHLSKVHDSANVLFACKVWGLRSTDIMQGVVYGTRTDEMINDTLLTRFDFDECFGTVINRYCAEAVIGHPLTPYGSGGQRRGFIDLIDSVQCLTIASENPPKKGEYRVFNQLDESYGIMELAKRVVKVGSKLGLDIKIADVANPRVEKEDHYYRVDNESLKKLGFRQTRKIDETIEIIIKDLSRFKERIEQKSQVILPKTTWLVGRKVISAEKAPVASIKSGSDVMGEYAAA
jgi:UDP-sulfoquinovose synthase